MKKDTRFLVMMGLQIAVLVGIGVVVCLLFLKYPSSSHSNIMDFQETAAKLQSAGLTSEAISYYEKYFAQNSHAPNDKKANLAYSLGELYEQEGQFEKALGWYYQVEQLDKNNPHLTDLSSKIVSLLERLKKYSAAKLALSERTTLNGGKQTPANAQVIAKIGQQNIYDYQIDQLYDQLPPQVQKEFSGKEGKINLLQKYVADELLHQKALRQQYDKLAETRQKIELLSKQVLVEKVLVEEIQSKLKNEKTDQDDIRNYFTANKDRYQVTAATKILLVESKDKSLLDPLKKMNVTQLMKKLEQEKSGSNLTWSTNWYEKGRPASGLNATQLAAISALANGSAWGPEANNDGKFLLALVMEKRPAQEMSFDQVKTQVANDYFQDKRQKLYQALIEETIKTEDVKLFPERVK